jgi:hypothetical protein
MSNSKYFSFAVTSPCHEDWDAMHEAQKGRFCDACQKTVVDFSEMTDAEIIAFFENYAATKRESICGRMDVAQADKKYILPATPAAYRPSSWRKWAAVLALTTSLVGTTPMQALPLVAPELQTLVADVSPQPEKTNTDESKSLSGTVRLKVNHDVPLNAATVILYRGETEIARATTNAKGEFILPIAGNIQFDKANPLIIKVNAHRYHHKIHTLTKKEIAGSKAITIFVEAEPRVQRMGGISYQESRGN